MGELVPYGKVWRTGADEATTLTTDKAHPDRRRERARRASTRSTRCRARADWQLIVNKQTGQWGTEYDQKQDLGAHPAQEERDRRPRSSS